MNGGDSRQVRIWDIWVRLFHWCLAGAIIFQLVSGETGWQFFDWHRQVGEAVVALLVFRIAWGLIGSSNARLVALLQAPAAAIRHLGELWRGRVSPERGHNAAGSWAIIALLLLVSVQAGTGLFIADEDEFIEGPLYGMTGADTASWLYRVHHTNATLLQGLVLLHVGMVFIYLLRAGTNLITPMVTGRMPWPTGVTIPEVRWQSVWVGAACAVLAAALVGWIVGW